MSSSPPWGRLQEIGGIEPLVFGQYGELSESFEGLIDTLAVKGCDQAADHYLLDVGPGAASVQKRLLRQRVNCCVARAQAGVLLRRRKDERDQAAQRAAQARAYSGEGHSEEWRFEFSRSNPHPLKWGTAGVRVNGGLRGRGCRLSV